MRILYTSALSALVVCGCDGPQSTLAPAGQSAEQLAELFWWMTGASFVIWFGVLGIAVYAIFVQTDRDRSRLLIIGGGVVFPTAVLAALLVYGLRMIPAQLAPPPPGALEVHVTGEQFWWRVHYRLPDGRWVETANELHLPVGRHVSFELVSPDVIHSFWIPALAGKMDMIPGRTNRLVLLPTRPGTYRGSCAEYCGAGHAWMSFSVFVVSEEELATWLAGQARPARTPEDGIAARGAELFLAHGCGACHTVRGTAADGVVGPDLTHVGSRATVGAGLLAGNATNIERWIARTDHLKPGAEMPDFGMLPPEDLRALAIYLETLE